jgi:hypothetical protein
MVLAAAILLILVVLAASVFAVGSDVFRRPAGERLHALKDWQGLIGAVLGFMGAAGVLVLGTAIEGEQERQRAAAEEHAIGYGLALEAERIANGLATVLGIVNLIQSDPDQDYQRTCDNFITTMTDVLDRETPVYDAALDDMIAFGDNNLSLFVRFFSLHGEIVQDLGRFDRKWCELDPQTQIADFGRRAALDLDFYRVIVSRYGTALIEPAPVESVAPAEQTSPDPAAEPPATASAVN